MNSFTIEPVHAGTIPVLAQLCLELWPDTSMEEEKENGETILNNENEAAYLVKVEEEYIGFIHVTLRFDYVEGADHSPVAYMEGIYVKKNYRHLGIGRLLVQAGENWARQKGCKQLASDTEIDNTGVIHFHTSNGFVESNRVVCFVKQL